jgi:wyosine [tRNA(Phe)-imidazoG37] synthetase (radical SAM superfamily)
MLGKTSPMTNTRQTIFPLQDILAELDVLLINNTPYDVISIVGEGEPTLYHDLKSLILEIKKRTSKPVTVITNGALLYDPDVRSALMEADIVLPTIDAYDEASLRRINRPHPSISFELVQQGLKLFTEEYQGECWLELMLMKGINDDDASLFKYKEMLAELSYSRLYINTPIRPPAVSKVQMIDHETMEKAVLLLGGISIELFSQEKYQSDIVDDYEAIISIIRRHPMNEFEIDSFLKTRGEKEASPLIKRLEIDPLIQTILYKGIHTYRMR